MRRALSSPPMSFFAVLFALLIEQLKPLPRDNWVHDTLIGVGRAGSAATSTPASARHALGGLVRRRCCCRRCWPWCCLIAAAHFSVLLALAFDVAVLYLTLGFRQFSHYFTDIRDALERGDEDEARRLLARVAARRRQRAAAHRGAAPRDRALAAGRAPPCVRRVLLVLVLSALGLGPAGAVLYRMAEFVAPLLGLPQRTLDAPANDAAAAACRSALFGLID